MTVTFFSNFLLHHQTPFCEAMVKLLGDGFKFVATEKIPEDRLSLGYRDLSHETDYAINSYESTEAYERSLNLGVESDVVIIGSAPDVFIEERLKHNKLTFRYQERYFKQGRWRILDPRVFILHYKKDFRYRNKLLYMLCASAYTAPDCRFIGCYKNKTFKWGYFPEGKLYDNIDKVIESKAELTILWAGRIIDWKHPEAAIYVAKKLKSDGYKFTLNIIGRGELEDKIKRMITDNGLQNEVHLLGSMSPEEVRTQMEKSEVFLFTSDRNEGWGAVLNESMNSACAVVANGSIGSVPYLIKDGENGLVYKNGNFEELYSNVKYLMDNAVERKNMAKNAYETLVSTWNADVAASRLLKLIECIKNGKDTPFTDGPCSKD